MFERGPFKSCPNCKTSNSLGILSAGGRSLNRRCTECRFSFSETLPDLEKQVIYLDQFAISEIFKTRAKVRRAGASLEDFWKEAAYQVNRTYLLQQAIFPASNIHRDETIVTSFARELALAHEMLSGDVSLIDAHQVTMLQVAAFAKAYYMRSAPNLSFDVDHILDGNDRNEWIADMHISANMDFSAFATHTRRNRDNTAQEFEPLLNRWTVTKPSFNEALENELQDHGRSKLAALKYAIERSDNADKLKDPIECFDHLSHPAMDEFRFLHSYFERTGRTSNEATQEVFKYWHWDGNREMPSNKISAYLFAAIARRMASGQKRRPTKGMFNDINAIAAYGPYVDAMFLDIECAQLLSERPLVTDLPMKAKIFCTRSGDKFLDYLKDLQARASEEVKSRAIEIYGISPSDGANYG